jgi:tetratricopeptide (TPR) repeat protein
MARTQLRMGRSHEASALLERCLECAPDFALARFNYADLLLKLKAFDSALTEIERLLKWDCSNVLFRQLKGKILEALGRSEEALELYDQLLAENPQRVESWISYGHAARALGLQKQSVDAYRKAIAVRPFSGVAYWSLANMKTVLFGDEDIAAIESHLKRPDLPTEDRDRLLFSLGKAYEDRGEYEKSFEQYARANAAMRLRLPHNPAKITRQVEQTKALFTKEFLKSRGGAGCEAVGPIFVVGLPRSGSTLIEQILSSHAEIEGTEELPYIGSIAREIERQQGKPDGLTYPEVLKLPSPALFSAFGEEYLARAAVHRKLNRRFFIDKEPPNWFHVGLIHLLLPNARIIDARRHPAACCFSMFKQYFSSKPRPRLAELARFYRDYVELMAHFDRVLPGKVHRVIYEEIVADPEREIRRMLDYLGLPFQESCLQFHESSRAVRTPSSEQVRRPISTDAVDHWRNYEPWLGPLISGLSTVFTAYPNVPADLH